MKSMLNFAMLIFFATSSLGAFASEDRGGSDHRRGKQFNEKINSENLELRRNHIEDMRKKHLELITKMYDLKLAHLSELEEIGKKIETASPEDRKALLESLKTKRKEHRKIQHEFREKTMKVEMREARENFKETMKSRKEEVKNIKSN